MSRTCVVRYSALSPNAESTREIVPRSYSFYKTVGGTETRTTRNFLLRARKQKRDEHGASFQSSPNYRKWSIKRRGSYCLFHVKGAALIQEWRLFESGAYFNYRYNTEGNIKPRIKWGAYYIHCNIIFFFLCNRVFSLTWPASMQIYWNKRKRLHKKRVQLPQDPFGTPTWPPLDTNMAAVTSCEKNTLHELWLLRLNYVRYRCGAYSSSGA